MAVWNENFPVNIRPVLQPLRCQMKVLYQRVIIQGSKIYSQNFSSFGSHLFKNWRDLLTQVAKVCKTALETYVPFSPVSFGVWLSRCRYRS
jgi:hypothetical protein